MKFKLSIVKILLKCEVGWNIKNIDEKSYTNFNPFDEYSFY